jgi:hypothetical protein
MPASKCASCDQSSLSKLPSSNAATKISASSTGYWNNIGKNNGLLFLSRKKVTKEFHKVLNLYKTQISILMVLRNMD